MPRPLVAEPATILEGMGEPAAPEDQPILIEGDPGQPTDPAASAAPAPAGDPAAAPPEEFYDYRWNHERSRIPRSIVGGLAEHIPGASEEGVVNWLQTGRDIHNQRAQFELERQRFEEDRAQFAAERQQMLDVQRDFELQQYPGSAGYGPPTRPPGPVGGYPPTQAPWGAPGAYPPAYPGAPGGAPPYGDPSASPGMPYLPTDPAARERMLLQSILSIPQQIAASNAQLRSEWQARDQAIQRREIAKAEREQAVEVKQAAAKFVDDLRESKFPVPKWFTADLIVRDANLLGLSMNPNLPWGQVFETVAGRRLWRQGFQLGQGVATERMDTDREAGFSLNTSGAPAGAPAPPSTPGQRQFRVPATKPQGSVASPAGAPAPNTLEARVAAARKLGDQVSFREAAPR